MSSAYAETWLGLRLSPVIKYSHLISGGPGFPGDAVAVEQLVGALV